MKRNAIIVLLTMGLLLVGGSIWLWSSLAPTPDANIPTPPGSPVIVMDISHIMAGERSNLSIYEDGTVIFIEEQGLRLPSPGHPATRTWKTGHLQEDELRELTLFFVNSHFSELNEYNQFPGSPIEHGGISFGDMSLTISIYHEDLSKTVKAALYRTPDKGLSYPDMPYPLNDIYQRLRGIAVITVEIAHETIS